MCMQLHSHMEFENCIIYDSFFECIPLYPRTQYLQLYIYTQQPSEWEWERATHNIFFSYVVSFRKVQWIPSRVIYLLIFVWIFLCACSYYKTFYGDITDGWLICVQQPQQQQQLLPIFHSFFRVQAQMNGREWKRQKIFTFYFTLTSLRSLNSNSNFLHLFFQCWMLLSWKLLLFSHSSYSLTI